MAAGNGLQLPSMTAQPIPPFPAAKALSLTEQPPAMLLAAGRGERMRPLTDTCPKPLLQVQGRPLLQHHLQALAQAGVRRAVVNTGWLGAQIPARFGPQFVPDNGGEPLQLAYSPEDRKSTRLNSSHLVISYAVFCL